MPIATKVDGFSHLLKDLKSLYGKSVDPDQTAPGAVCSGSTLFASILNSSVLFAADDFSRRHFQMHFFLGALRVKVFLYN